MITNKINGKKYIGQTTRSVEKRFQEHMGKWERCTKLKRAVSKYGADSFTVETVWSGSGRKEIITSVLNALEIAWIKYYDSYNKGYNCTMGGNNGTVGYKHTDTAKKKMSIAKKGKHFVNSGTFKKGHKPSKESIDASISVMGHKVAVYKDGEFIGVWRSQRECGRDLHIGKDVVRMHYISGEPYKNYIFKRYEDQTTETI